MAMSDKEDASGWSTMSGADNLILQSSGQLVTRRVFAPIPGKFFLTPSCLTFKRVTLPFPHVWVVFPKEQRFLLSDIIGAERASRLDRVASFGGAQGIVLRMKGGRSIILQVRAHESWLHEIARILMEQRTVVHDE
jgi:hypothetical protein